MLKTVLLYAVIIIVIANAVSYIRSPSFDTKTPELKSELIVGKSISLENYRGKPLIVHFWATWCPTCKLEAPAIESLHHDFQVLTIAVQSGNHDEIQSFMDERNYSYHVVNDEDGDIARSFKVKAFPTTFVLDSNGKIVFTEVGYTSNIGFRIRMNMTE